MSKAKRASACLLAMLFSLAMATPPKPGAKPVDLTLRNMQGERVHLRDYRGKVVVLNFWATWCGPCKDEMPMIAAAEKEYRDRGVVFIGASLDDGKTERHIPEFTSKYQVEFAVWKGASGDDLEKLAMGPAVPATAFLDKQGRIVARVSGEIRKNELDERIVWLLGDGTGPAPQAFVEHLERD